MLHRVFIAVNLPEEIREKLFSFQKEYPSIPAKWVGKENIHITVLFLGNLDDNQLFKSIQTAEKILERHKPFLIKIDRLIFGPENKFPPRMIWAEIGKNQSFAALKGEVEDALFGLPEYTHKEREKRAFNPHITVARIKSFKFRNLAQRPEIDVPLDIQVKVNSIDIMESELTKKGPEYTVLKSINL